MCFKSYRNHILFLATGPESILGDPNFIKKKYRT